MNSDDNGGSRPVQIVVTLVALVMSLALMVMGVQLYTSLDDKNREALQHAFPVTRLLIRGDVNGTAEDEVLMLWVGRCVE